MEKKIVYYSEFGAVGDGVHEDFEAIVKCHEYANENGCKVMADAGKSYYIENTDGVSAIVKTDVDWVDATFIIDDRNIGVENKSRTAHIFRILRDHASVRHEENSDLVKALNAKCPIDADSFTNIGYAPGYPALLAIYDNEHTAYLRWGCHATGKPNPQRELIVVDAEGNIDPNTKFLLDYNHVSYVDEFRIDDTPITVENGIFITRANAAPPKYTSYARGLAIERSNVTIRGTVHKITDEGPYGAPYQGFISWYGINNLLCENLSLVSHKSYKDYEYDEEGKVVKVHSIMGSYDIGGSFTTNVKFKNCTQSNFWKYEAKRRPFSERERWGIMGTNYCKNLTYEDCLLSRLDAHAGVYNVTIKNTTISYIKLTGGGKALIENSTIIVPDWAWGPVFELRADYGSTWKGDILVKDCVYINEMRPENYLCYAKWNNWPFGYTTYLPNITFDNLKIDKPLEKNYIFTPLHPDPKMNLDEPTLYDGNENKNPMVITPTITIKNNNGYNFVACPTEYVSEKIKIVEE